MENHFHRFKLTSDNFGSYGKHVYLDGHEVKGVTSVTVSVNACDVPKVTIEMLPREIVIEDMKAFVCLDKNLEESNATESGNE